MPEAHSAEVAPRRGPPPLPPQAPATEPARTSGGDFATWHNQPAYRPSLHEGGTAVREAMRSVRRATLTRVVKGVVMLSMFVCVAGVARVAIAKVSASPLEVSHASRVFLRQEEVAQSFHTVHRGAAVATVHGSKRGGGHSVARAHALY